MTNTEKPTVAVPPSPKPRNTQPTIAQIIAFNLLVDAIKSGKATATNFGAILKEAGFSDSVVKNPKLIRESKGFRQLMAEHYPDEKKVAKHKQLLEASTLDHYVFPTSMTDEEMTAIVEAVPGSRVNKIVHGDQSNRVYYFMPDNSAQLMALDKLYKVQGDYAAEKLDVESSKIDEALEKLTSILP